MNFNGKDYVCKLTTKTRIANIMRFLEFEFGCMEVNKNHTCMKDTMLCALHINYNLRIDQNFQRSHYLESGEFIGIISRSTSDLLLR